MLSSAIDAGMQNQVAHKIEEHTTTNLNAASLWPFIEGQAVLHDAQITGNLITFQQHLKQDKQRSQRSDRIRILNCRIYTLDDEPSAYVLFNPAFDSAGNFGYYMEDIFVPADGRNQGMGKKIMAEMSKRATSDGATFIKWVTDERNIDMMRFSENKLKAVRADEENLDASSLLQGIPPLNAYALEEYDTRLVTVYDAAELKQLGLSGDRLASKSFEALPLVGFITREKNSPNTVVAATMAYLNYSTFKTSWGMNVEPIVFKPGTKDETKIDILHSTIKAIRDYQIPQLEFNEYANGSTPPAPPITFAKWHSKKGTIETEALKKDFGLATDNMVSHTASSLILYVMPEAAVEQAAQLNRA